jgi:hypothetical protein
MPDFDDLPASVLFSKAIAEARAHLWREMEARGLYARDGWKVTETTRAAGGGSQLVLRPLHLQKPAPDDLECVVAIDEDAKSIDMDCTP